MDDNGIIELYWARSERAITETDTKYGRLCRGVAMNILGTQEDSEECVSDTWMRAWESIPPQRPAHLGAFLCRITRNLSLNLLKRASAKKRGGGQLELALEELGECAAPGGSAERTVEDRELTELLNGFLAGLGSTERKIFIRRYWYLSPIREIAAEYGLGESRVKMSLMRTRNRLRQRLIEEGYSDGQ